MSQPLAEFIPHHALGQVIDEAVRPRWPDGKPDAHRPIEFLSQAITCERGLHTTLVCNGCAPYVSDSELKHPDHDEVDHGVVWAQ